MGAQFGVERPDTWSPLRRASANNAEEHLYLLMARSLQASEISNLSGATEWQRSERPRHKVNPRVQGMYSGKFLE